MGSATDILFSDSQHIRAQSQIDAARITQKSGNERRIAEATAARTAQGIANRRTLDAAGAQIGAISENIVRNLDAATAGTVSARIAAAESLGATVAGAAAAGVGGSSVELFKATQRLKQGIGEEQQARNINSALYASEAAKGDTMTNAIEGLDNTTILPNLDSTVFVDHKKMSGFTRLLALSGAAAATYYGGPQAGMAVLDTFSAANKARNGDFAGAGAKMEAAVGRGISGAQTSRSLAGKGENFGSWWEAVWKNTNKVEIK